MQLYGFRAFQSHNAEKPDVSRRYFLFLFNLKYYIRGNHWFITRQSLSTIKDC